MERNPDRKHLRKALVAGPVALLAVLAGVVQFTGHGVDVKTMVLGASTKKTDNIPPTVALTSPTNNGLYGPANWTGCSPAGICGTASDDSGVAEVDVAVRQAPSGNYWNGSA